MTSKITVLYEYFKNTPKKLKIVCDWDEVIQNCEQYAGWKAFKELSHFFRGGFHETLEKHFKDFWDTDLVEYSPYGSKIKEVMFHGKTHLDKYLEIKNSPNFYQQAPFLTIAEDLLKLIKEDKVERLIFLSAYDKRKFPEGDMRKWIIFDDTFGRVFLNKDQKPFAASLKLIPFDSETQGQNKADWIKENASDFDIVIDDNPNICKKVNNIFAKMCHSCYSQIKDKKEFSVTCFHPRDEIKVTAPYYPVLENQHDERVLLVKNEVSDLKKEDFNK